MVLLKLLRANLAARRCTFFDNTSEGGSHTGLLYSKIVLIKVTCKLVPLVGDFLTLMFLRRKFRILFAFNVMICQYLKSLVLVMAKVFCPICMLKLMASRPCWVYGKWMVFFL